MAKANAMSRGSAKSSSKKRSNQRWMKIGWLFQLTIYKRNQGRVSRQVTFAALAVGVIMASWSFSGFLQGQMAPQFWQDLFADSLFMKVYLPTGSLMLLGCWIGFRVAAGWPRFSDFLISVEAEMTKVSWPSRAELYRASLVVVVVIFLMAVLLFGFDLFWRWLFQLIGVLKS